MLRALAFALAAVLVAITVGRAARSWPHDAHLSYAEGIWLGLAVDASHGVIYRPLDGEEGIGGTRYLPLFYLITAAAIRVGFAPVTAGYLVAALSIVLLITALILLLRRLGVDSTVAVTAAAAALACQPVQMAWLGTRGDALAAALAILGLAFALPGPRRWIAPVLFAMAVITKPTSVYAPFATVVALAIGGQRIDARRLALQTAAWLLVAIAALIALSQGRFITVLLASGGGGAGLSSILSAPLSAARILRRVPEAAFFIQLAAAVVIAVWRWGLSLERAAWTSCLAVTLAIYASPATIENHLIDLTVLAVAVVAVWAAREPRWTSLALSIFLVGGAAAGAAALWRSQAEDTIDHRATRQEVLTALQDTRGPILFDQPMLAVDRGEAPYVIDQYAYAVRVARDPSAVEPLVHDIEAGKFGAIVFENLSLDLSIADAFPGDAGTNVRAALDRAYRLDGQVGGRLIYRRR